ncbi:MAG: hypothetical protein WAT16_02900, partial [Saprospiraceae bacterium]
TGGEFPTYYGTACRIVIRKSCGKCFIEFQSGYREIVLSKYLVKSKSVNQYSPSKNLSYAS